jgi:hypothetical protein
MEELLTFRQTVMVAILKSRKEEFDSVLDVI